MTAFAAAMILAAGRGERMRPLSDALAKPALPLTDGPVVASALRLAVRAGADRIVVNTWHLGETVSAALAAAAAPGTRIELSPEPSLMGTAGGLALARDRGLLGTEGPIVVVNGDCVSRLDIDHLLERHAAGDDLVTLGLLPHPDPARWSRVLVDRDGLVTAIRSPGRIDLEEVPDLYPGVMAVSRAALDKLPAEPGEIPDRLWFPALENRRLGGARVVGSWREVGTPSDYLAAVMAQLAGASFIDPTADVASTAVLESSYIGAHARVADRCTVRGSVIATGASIAAGGRVVDSVLLGAIRAAPGEPLDRVFRAAAPGGS